MAQIQLIKRRMRSVNNTRQITKAMEMVAASKMRRAQEAALRSRTYTNSAKEVLARLNQLTPAANYPLFERREAVARRLIILITSDRGLAGAYNANLARLFIENIQADQARGTATSAIVIGAQGARLAARLDGVDLVGTYPDWPSEPTAADIRPISHTAIRLFADRLVDAVEVIYTNFISTIRQEAIFEPLLPALLPLQPGLEHELKRGVMGLEEATFEPSPESVMKAVVPRMIEAQLFQATLEAVASEQSMRMMAMKNASDNASELIEDLTLTYNGARQAGITQELAEITAGAEAIS
ncbi:ATP synthase F1 subunit gamma [Candidatus Parcubacteria bacterium]|nr:ATP synthase F1 subunit gamma [Candidatus Parcubacteria bacterium]